jgi:hypothetical protein
MMVIPNRVSVAAVITALALAGGLLSLALLANPTQAKPPTDNENRGATSQEFPLTGSIGTPPPEDPGCGTFGEVINIEGTLHIVTHFFADEEGGYHLNSHYNAQHVTGVGVDPITSEPTGTEYVYATSGAFVENYIPATGQVNTGSVDLYLIIQKGPGTTEDETLTKQVTFIRIHYIIDTDGTVKVENVEFHRQCV